MADKPIEAIYSSPLCRALETAWIVAAQIPVEVRTDPLLQEIHAGIFQNRLRSELQRLYPHELARWNSEDPDYVIPGGESRAALCERGLKAFAAIARAGHQQALVVSHGRLLVTTLKALLAIPAQEPPFSLQNGSITTLALHDGKAELLALNQVDHLAGVGISGQGDL